MIISELLSQSSRSVLLCIQTSYYLIRFGMHLKSRFYTRSQNAELVEIVSMLLCGLLCSGLRLYVNCGSRTT